MALRTAAEANKIANDNLESGTQEQLATIENIINQSAAKGYKFCFWNGDFLPGVAAELYEKKYEVKCVGQSPHGFSIYKIEFSDVLIPV